MKTRIQATTSNKGKDAAVTGKDGKVSIVKVILRIFREEGFSAFYNGFGASMLNTFSTRELSPNLSIRVYAKPAPICPEYAYFFFYSLVRGAYLKRITKGAKKASISTAMELLLGAIAGALAQIFTIPVSVIATRQQIGNIAQAPSKSVKGPAPSSPSEVSPEKPAFNAVADPSSSVSPKTISLGPDNSFLAVGREIVEKEGVAGLWLGLKPSLVLTVNPAITYGVFERIKGLMLVAKESAGGDTTKLTPWQSFFVGAMSKTLATVVTYPYIMAKVRIQASGSSSGDSDLPSPATEKKQSKSAVSLLRNVLKDEGLLGWYQGMSAQLIKAVLTQALLFMSKEQFEQYALAIMMMQARLRIWSAKS